MQGGMYEHVKTSYACLLLQANSTGTVPAVGSLARSSRRLRNALVNWIGLARSQQERIWEQDQRIAQLEGESPAVGCARLRAVILSRRLNGLATFCPMAQIRLICRQSTCSHLHHRKRHPRCDNKSRPSAGACSLSGKPTSSLPEIHSRSAPYISLIRRPARRSRCSA